MDVRESLNTEDNLELVAEEGAYCNIENDSFFARVPPQAASTVGRPKSRLVRPQDKGHIFKKLIGPAAQLSRFWFLTCILHICANSLI